MGTGISQPRQFRSLSALPHPSLNWGLGTELIAESAIFWNRLAFDLVAGGPEYWAMILRPEILRGGGL